MTSGQRSLAACGLGIDLVRWPGAPLAVAAAVGLFVIVRNRTIAANRARYGPPPLVSPDSPSSR